jgi:hypothetical protein
LSFDFCARCGHAHANHARGTAGGRTLVEGACLFSSCDCPEFVPPITLECLRELRRRLAGEVLDARRQALGHDDDAHTRQAAEYRGFGDGLDRAIVLLDELVPGAKP